MTTATLQSFGAVAYNHLWLGPDGWYTAPNGGGIKAEDSTAAIQAALDSGAEVVDGQGKCYVFSSLKLNKPSLHNGKIVKSLRGFAPQQSGGKSNMVHVGDDQPRAGNNGILPVMEDITISNVHLNGARQLQTDLAQPNVADGEMDGFQYRGRTRNMKLINSSATECATDGLEIHQGIGSELVWDIPNNLIVKDDIPRHQNFLVDGFEAKWNRRHGISGQSMQDTTLRNITANLNGLNCDGSFVAGDPSAGWYGAVQGGLTYGSGIDLESEVQALGARVVNLTMEDVEALHNVRYGVLMIEFCDPGTAGFRPWERINLNKVVTDPGLSNPNGPYGASAVQITASTNPAFLANGPAFRFVEFSDCELRGTISLRGVDDYRFIGGSILAPFGSPTIGAFPYSPNGLLRPQRAPVTRIVPQEQANCRFDDALMQ